MRTVVAGRTRQGERRDDVGARHREVRIDACEQARILAREVVSACATVRCTKQLTPSYSSLYLCSYASSALSISAVLFPTIKMHAHAYPGSCKNCIQARVRVP
jgi:hypothetical protein